MATYRKEIADHYETAGRDTKAAQGLIDSWKGKGADAGRPADLEQQIDALLDSAEKATQEAERMERLEKLDGTLNAPDESKRLEARGGQPGQGRERTPEQKAFEKFLRYGIHTLHPDEVKALSVSSQTEGGYLVAPQQFVMELLKGVDNETFVRQYARKFQLAKAQSMGVPTFDTDLNDADWTAELTQTTQDNALRLGKRQLSPSPLSKEVLLSNTLIRQSGVDAEGLVRDRLAYKFAVTQEKAYLNGTGQNQPLGVFTPDASGVPASRDVTAAGAAAITGDDLINVKHFLKAQYWAHARWSMHRDILKTIRKIKDSTNQYIWAPGLAGGMPNTILDLPYDISEYAPSTLSTGQYTLLLGDWRFYWIADALDMSVQVVDQLYARTNQTAYIARAESDGAPVLAEAFARMKQA